jgi:hypothetical protein
MKIKEYWHFDELHVIIENGNKTCKVKVSKFGNEEIRIEIDGLMKLAKEYTGGKGLSYFLHRFLEGLEGSK